MSKPGKAKTSEKSAARGERLRAALRENLKRRKAQARGRAGAGESGGHAPDAVVSADGGVQPKTPDFRRNRGNE